MNMNSLSVGCNSKNDDPIIVFDIGCRWGGIEKFLQFSEGNSFRIYGFDPDAEECKRLEAAYEKWPQGTVQCVPVALAGAEGKRDLYVTKDPACSSLHRPIQFLAENYPALEVIRLEKNVSIDVTTLDKWTQENAVQAIDYLKIDTQGSELEILKGGERILDSVRCIDIEVEFNPIYEGQSLFGETDAYLRSKGFMLWRLSNLVHYSIGAKRTELNEINSTHFDTVNRFEVPALGGQLFWADARYIHANVFKGSASQPLQSYRDKRLFDVLNMPDVIDHINQIFPNL